jgi:3-hydroxybutyrate dehydrogenase
MKRTLEGKVALVTGSTSGIGLGMAKPSPRRAPTSSSTASATPAHRGDPARDRGEHAGVRALYDGADMSRPDQIAAMVDRARRELGSLDILVNNAGIQHTAPVQEFPTEKWDAIIAINLSAAFHATRAALPGMLGRGWGRIVNVASAHGLVASAQKSAYVAAKHGLVGLTKVVALETATTGVTCNAVCPGWVLTPLVQKQIDARARDGGIPAEQAELELLAEKQPSHAFVTPEQLAGLVLFLCSPAADQIRGAALPVDGGWTAQ